MKTALYRMWGNDGQLLYVGISKSALVRLGQHLTEKSWAVDIVNVTIETFPTREQAAAAEVAAIKDEKPLHNLTHNNNARENKSVQTQVFASFTYSITLGGYRDVKVGQHVALGLDDGKCPIGRILSIEKKNQDWFIHLQLKSWVTGFYDRDIISVRASKVFACEIADEKDGCVNDYYLGQVQNYWTNLDKSIVNPLPYWVVP